MNELAEVHKYAALWNEGKAALSFPTLTHFVWLIFLVWLSHPTLKFTTSTKLLSTPYKNDCFPLSAHGVGHILLCGIFLTNLYFLPVENPLWKNWPFCIMPCFYDIIWKFWIITRFLSHYAIILLKSWDYSIVLTFIPYIPLTLALPLLLTLLDFS